MSQAATDSDIPDLLSPDAARKALWRFRRFSDYAGAYWKLPTKSKGYVPFALNPAQRLLDAEYRRQMREWACVRLNVLKCRQVGATTYWTRRALHYVLSHCAKTALTIAHDVALPRQWLVNCREALENSPKDKRPEAESTQANEVRFAHGSRYYIGSAQGGFPGVGDTIHFLHVSELGRWDKPPISVDPANILGPLSPAIPTGEDRVGSVIVYESTGVMVGDYWHHLWRSSGERGSEYGRIFLPWFLVGEYRRDDLADDVLDLTEYECDLVRIAAGHGVELDKSQIAWRRKHLAAAPFFGDVPRWSAEYPATEEEAFLSPGGTVFTDAQISAARSTVRAPAWRGDLAPAPNPIRYRLAGVASGALLIWDHDPSKSETPDPTRHYVIGADVQWGTKDTADYDCAFVECVETGKLCAMLRGRWDMGYYSRLLASLGHYYGTGRLGPERNSEGGKGVIRPLLGLAGNDWRYPNVYIRTKDKPFGALTWTDYGWFTDTHTKADLIIRAKECLDSPEGMDWADQTAVDELATFIIRDDLTMGAIEGANDDCVMARMIAKRIAQEWQTELLQSMPGPEKPRKMVFRSNDQRIRDMEAAQVGEEHGEV